MHLKKADFDQGINMITQVFGEAPVKGPRLQRIKNLALGRVSGQGFIEVCETICDNFRQVPLPNDFDKAIHAWRKNFSEQNGYAYSDHGKQGIENIQFTRIICSLCNDVGMLRITHRVPSNFESLMRCTCGQDETEPSIPEWDAQLSGAYHREACPADWFKPKIAGDDSDQEVSAKIWDTVEFWKRKKRQAVKHWDQVRSKISKGVS